MIVTKKSLARRTFLRGVGATVALPLLDSMIPALTAMQKTSAAPIRRFGIVYIPHGVLMQQWTPAEEGPGFKLTPILEPLAPFRNRVTVVTGLDSNPATPLFGETAGGHARASGSFLTCVRIKKTEGADIQAGISVDQVVAKDFGRQTQLTSLELSLEPNELLGVSEGFFSAAYTNTLCWRNATTPLPMENNPRAVFERLYGTVDSTDTAARLSRIREDRSILDFVMRDVHRLERQVGARDRTKLGEYMEAVRDVERRIHKAEEQSARDLPEVERPAGIPGTFEEHVKLMFDLAVLAYQTDLTRVTTLLMAREHSGRTFPEVDVREGHHPLSHNNGDPDKVAKFVTVNTYHVKMFAYFLDRLRSTLEGDGSLLDRSMVLFGSGMSNGNLHDVFNLPVLVAGGRAEQHKGDRHIRVAKGTPLANLNLTLLERLGVPAESFGDSTGFVDL